ncbi:hypothetical protein Ocin01_17016 [Orchesella cincta]|uniref:Coiled-coil domain-containing protein n=1 Tax=Orchesella cincta TaxID=48709 RepID=A0A1D2M9K5_ORCCI|nr:hypothetical protein Ocin01_17016 [Orchesella cincta]
MVSLFLNNPLFIFIKKFEGERKGTNKYYPPDYDPKKGGLNKFMGTHALRERARKLHLGIMIIRFEMPYNIWCEGCNNHIGMGVRYNAEKSKVGMYYSTPVYQFRMKCHLCDNHFEIKTDPANLDYVIINGARRQERRWDPTENGQVVPDDKQVIHKLADDAMFKLQHGVEDQRKLKDVTPTLSKLENLQERWKDDYMANRALRDRFRERKREIKEQQDKDNEFLKKRSLDIPLLQESEDDAKVASLIRLQPTKSIEERQQEKREEISKKSQFPYPLLSVGDAPANDKTENPQVSSSSKPVQSCLNDRRLLFGIKLKHSGVSSAATSTTATTADQLKRLETSSSVFQNGTETVTEIPHQLHIVGVPKVIVADSIDVINEDSFQIGNSTEANASITSNPNTLVKNSSIIAGGGLSGLVSYSDDSNQSLSDQDN